MTQASKALPFFPLHPIISSAAEVHGEMADLHFGPRTFQMQAKGLTSGHRPVPAPKAVQRDPGRSSLTALERRAHLGHGQRDNRKFLK